ncbi:hypothetical protein ABIC90_004393 [Variovorax boronicumulans]
MKIQCIERDVRQMLELRGYLIPCLQRPYSWDACEFDPVIR